MAKVLFNYADVSAISLQNKTEVKNWVKTIFDIEGKPLEKINYIFCTDNYLLHINKSFLNHDEYTDIVTFDLSDESRTIGEIYISAERVAENASIHKSPFRQELLRVIFHGALHLIGYNDKKKSEITIMRQKEDYYLRLFETK